jgi:hypothetical protein
VLAQKDKKESCLRKIEGQHAFTADLSDDCIELNNRRIRVLLPIR